MKAVINARYGSPDVLEIRQVPKPEPRAGEVLIRVHATTVSRTDCGMLRPHPFFVRFFAGLRRPKRTTLGMDFAGEVEAVGAGVTSFKPGDRVFGVLPDVYGAHAEYLCVPEKGAIATMPAGARFRRGRGMRGGLVCGHVSARVPPQVGPQHPRLWCFRRHRHGGGAACEVLRRQGDGGRRDAAPGPRQNPRR